MVAQLWPRVPELALLLLLLLLLNARQSQGQEPQAPPGDAPQVHVQNHQYHAPKIVDGGDSGLEISLLATIGFVVILLVALYCGTRKPSKWALEQQQLELQSLLSITDDSEYGVTDRVLAPAGAALASNAGSSSTSHAWQIRSRQTAAASDEPAAVSGLTGGARSTSRYEFRMRALVGSGLPPPPPAPPRVVGSGLVVQQNIHRHPAGPVRTLPTSQLPTMPPQQRRPEPVPHVLAGTPYGAVVITDLEDL